jgi:hypothetical protein
VCEWLVVRAARFPVDFERHREDANTLEIAPATVERRAACDFFTPEDELPIGKIGV